MPLVSPFVKAMCPYCFERFHPADCPLRRRVVDGRAEAAVEPVPDELVRKFFGSINPISLPPVEPPAPRSWLNWQLDTSKDGTHDRICPKCHLPLPLGIGRGQTSGDVIAVVGERGSGKSVYFGVLLKQLTDGRLATDAHCGIYAQPTFDLNRETTVNSRTLYHERYGRHLYGQRATLPPSAKLSTNPELRAPLIYRVQVNHPTRTTGVRKAIDLLFYDTAGEDFEDMKQAVPYLKAASGLILLFNPLFLPGIRDRIPERIQASLSPEMRKQMANPDASLRMLDNLLLAYEQHGGSATALFNVPTVVTLSMSDVLRDLVDPGSRFLQPSAHRGGFDAEDFAGVSNEVRGHMDQWASGSMIENMRNFRRLSFSAVSALGGQPNADGTIPAISPNRVGDPLFWVLNTLGYLPAQNPTGRAS